MEIGAVGIFFAHWLTWVRWITHLGEVSEIHIRWKCTISGLLL